MQAGGNRWIRERLRKETITNRKESKNNSVTEYVRPKPLDPLNAIGLHLGVVGYVEFAAAVFVPSILAAILASSARGGPTHLLLVQHLAREPGQDLLGVVPVR